MANTFTQDDQTKFAEHCQIERSVTLQLAGLTEQELTAEQSLARNSEHIAF